MRFFIENVNDLRLVSEKAIHIIVNLDAAEKDCHSEFDIRGIKRIEKWKSELSAFVEELKSKHLVNE